MATRAKQTEEQPKVEEKKVEKMSPSKYAAERGITPQRVYAAIRNGKLEGGKCDTCDRPVIDVAAADAIFGK